MPTAVQFGAGNIGRGFLAQLFHESGLEVVFVDVAVLVVDALNARREYEIEIVGPNAATIPINNVRALHGTDTKSVVNAIVEASVVCTAVGANVLPQLANTIALGLTRRWESTRRPLNILVCENLHNAADTLRNHVRSCLFEDSRDDILENTGFVQAVVSRMVPLQVPPADNPLRIQVEAYKRLPLDAIAVLGDFPQIVGAELVENFAAHVERKLYSHNCGHATLGYVGHAAKYAFGYEALRDPRINAFVRAVLDETSQALIAAHGFEEQEQAAHVADLLTRFDNPALGDTCLRLARDPIRKLAPHDRLAGAARCCEAQNIAPNALVWAIAAALRFEDERDPVSLELQAMRRELGDERTLNRISGIAPDEPLAARITEALTAAQ